ncbi:TPA: hypothetical protein ACX96Z_003532 [Clostridium sporogenes]
MKNKKIKIGIGVLAIIVVSLAIGFLKIKESNERKYYHDYKIAKENIVESSKINQEILLLYIKASMESGIDEIDFQTASKYLNSKNAKRLKELIEKSGKNNDEITKTIIHLNNPPKKYEKHHEYLTKMDSIYVTTYIDRKRKVDSYSNKEIRNQSFEITDIYLLMTRLKLD